MGQIVVVLIELVGRRPRLAEHRILVVAVVVLVAVVVGNIHRSLRFVRNPISTVNVLEGLLSYRVLLVILLLSMLLLLLLLLCWLLILLLSVWAVWLLLLTM